MLADTDRFLASAGACRLPGDDAVGHVAMSRHWQSRKYQRRVNSWQLQRHFEII